MVSPACRGPAVRADWSRFPQGTAPRPGAGASTCGAQSRPPAGRASTQSCFPNQAATYPPSQALRRIVREPSAHLGSRASGTIRGETIQAGAERGNVSAADTPKAIHLRRHHAQRTVCSDLRERGVSVEPADLLLREVGEEAHSTIGQGSPTTTKRLRRTERAGNWRILFRVRAGSRRSVQRTFNTGAVHSESAVGTTVIHRRDQQCLLQCTPASRTAGREGLG